ncbi:hypothetical protein WMY93_004670 [Mugilogobius chulae]|uniref:Flavin-containing monooxygenase n=1 Tax=Mugilogobius chulae TaxID=88201 RepID=A0AAW0PPM2_9GOBI
MTIDINWSEESRSSSHLALINPVHKQNRTFSHKLWPDFSRSRRPYQQYYRMVVQRVAVIGAGLSGLSCVKSCLEEGLQPTCFESGPDLAGSGAHLPNHMHHSDLLGYLRLYAQHFKLLPHIQFKTTVQKVRKTPDFTSTGQWEVHTETENGQKQTHVFDAVIVCTGHYTQPHLPLQDFPGLEKFEGRYFHSWEYRNCEGLQGKRVVVIGIGNSGGDIAVEASRVAEKVYLSTRRERGSLVDWDQIPVVNDDLPARILSGRVQVKANVKEVSGSSVVFEDGTVIDEVDVVILCTGYDYSFPFLPPELQSKCSFRLRLYKHILPPALEHPTLAVVGFIHTLGAINPMAEMQGRWATRVFKGIIKLPSEETMNREIERDTEVMNQGFLCSVNTPLQVDYLSYMDSLAGQLGVRPSLLRLLLTDPRLALKVWFGPCTPYQYRLTDRDAGAEHARPSSANGSVCFSPSKREQCQSLRQSTCPN